MEDSPLFLPRNNNHNNHNPQPNVKLRTLANALLVVFVKVDLPSFLI